MLGVALSLLIPLPLPPQSLPSRPQSDSQRMPVARRVVGRVVDTAGAPVAGATLVAGDERAIATTLNGEPLARSAADGTFALDLGRVPPPNPRSDGLVVAVAAAGLATAWLVVPFASGDGGAVPHDLGTVTLARGKTLRGMVTSAGGGPLAGARVRVRDLLMPISWRGACYAAQTFTDKDGMFALPGVADGALELRAEADGYARTVLRPVRCAEIQSVELRPTGFVQGRIEAAGRPGIARGVHLAFEWSEDSPWFPARADGSFRVPIPFAGRFVVVAGNGNHPGLGSSGVLGGPPEEPVVVPLAADSAALCVRARDRETRAPLLQVRGGLTLDPGPKNMDFWVNGHTLRALAASADDGLLRLTLGEERTMHDRSLLLLAATGYRTAVVPNPKPGKDGTLTVDLDRRPAVTGVVAGPDGAPRAGVTVALRRDSELCDSHVAHAVTDAAGRFAFTEVWPGRVVVETLTGGPARQRCEVDADGAAVEVLLQVRRSSTVRGEAKHAPRGARLLVLPAAAAARWRRELAFAGVAGLAPPPGSVPIAADGTFALDTAESAPLAVVMWAPSEERSGPAIAVVVHELTGSELEAPLELDLSRDGPGRIVAELARKGPWLPRLALTSTLGTPPRSGRIDEPLPWVRWCEPRGQRFELTVLPGTQHVELVDLGTGLRVWSSGEVRVPPGGEVPLRIDVDLACIELKLRGPGGVPVAAEWLQIHTGERARTSSAGSYMPVHGGGHLLSLPGVDLLGRFGTIPLLVPAGPVRLCSCAGWSALGRAGKEGGGSPTALDELIEVAAGKAIVEVELELRQAYPCRAR